MFNLWDVVDIKPNPNYNGPNRGQIQGVKLSIGQFEIFTFNHPYSTLFVDNTFLETYCSSIDMNYQIGNKVTVQYPTLYQVFSYSLKLSTITKPNNYRGKIGTITQIYDDRLDQIEIEFKKQPQKELFSSFNLVKVNSSPPTKREDKGGLWLL